MITKKEFDQMTSFFLKTYFDSIPLIPCKLVAKKNFEKGVTANFVLEQNEDYDMDDDDLLHSPEYGKRVNISEGFGFDYGAQSWEDPLNHPKVYIEVTTGLKEEPLRLVGTLLHELTHYWCWYCGYDHSDGTKQFENKLKELGLPSNWEHSTFIKSEKKWIDSFDYTTMQKYYDAFRKSIK